MNDGAVKQMAGEAVVGLAPFSYRKLVGWSWWVVSKAPTIFALSVLMSIGVKQLPLYLLDLFKQIDEHLRTGGELSSVRGLAELFFSLTLVLAIGQWLNNVVTVLTDAKMLRHLQQTLHDRLLAVGPEYHDHHDVGENNMIVLQDAAGSQQVFRNIFVSTISLSAAFITALSFLLSNFSKIGSIPNWLVVVLFASIVLVPVCGWWLQRRLGAAFALGRASFGALNNEFLNSASTPLEVRRLGALPQRSAAFGRRLDMQLKANVRAQVRMHLANGFSLAAPEILQAAFILIGVAIASLTQDGIAAGAILGIYLFVPAALSPVQQIIGFVGSIRMSWPSVARVGGLLDLDLAPLGTETLPEAGPEPVGVALENVTFSYRGVASPVLQGLSHVFEPGLVTAIVGRAGAGKSSILGLIDGMRAPDSGAVTLAGRNIAAVSPASLHRMVAVVSQFPMFISDTVRANFQLAKADADDGEIESICRRVDLWETFVRLSPGAPLDYVMSRTAGKDLSGGERRLLGLARVILRKPSVLLLDEPTTGVDAMTIDRLCRFLEEETDGKTVILIEHNLDFVMRMADRVCCLQDGKFVDYGAPVELAARPSLFRDLLDSRDRQRTTEDMTIERFPLPILGKGAAERLSGMTPAERQPRFPVDAARAAAREGI